MFLLPEDPRRCWLRKQMSCSIVEEDIYLTIYWRRPGVCALRHCRMMDQRKNISTTEVFWNKRRPGRLALHTTALQDDGPEDIQSVHARSRGQMVEGGFLQHLDNLHSLKMLLAYTFKKCCYVTCHAQGRWVLPCWVWSFQGFSPNFLEFFSLPQSPMACSQGVLCQVLSSPRVLYLQT